MLEVTPASGGAHPWLFAERSLHDPHLVRQAEEEKEPIGSGEGQ